MERKPSVSVGLRRGRMFVIPYWSPGKGTYIHKDPVLEVSPTDAQAIGGAVFESFKSFVWDNSPLPDWDTYPDHVLDAGGFKSWSEYERGLKDCEINFEDEQYHIYTELPHIYLPLDVSAEQMGHAVLKALGTSVEKEAKLAERRRKRAQK